MEQEKRSILVVDGSASFIFYTAMMLKKLQYSVQSASNAADALSLIARSAPAVVITDTLLPGTGGLDLLKQIKRSESLRFIPVIVHSSEVDPDIKNECMDAGCTAFFCKPAEPEALFKAIQAATESTPRRHIRIATCLRARIAASPGRSEPERTEEVIQLSEGGLYIKTSRPAPQGAIVPLTLLIERREIPVHAEVLYSSKPGGRDAAPGMGLRFRSLDPGDLAFLREFIRRHVLSTMTQG